MSRSSGSRASRSSLGESQSVTWSESPRTVSTRSISRATSFGSPVHNLSISEISKEKNLIKYVSDQTDLEKQLVEAGNKLAVIPFLLLGNEISDNMLAFLSEKASMYKDSLVVLVVDVNKLGELAKRCEAVQIPWFAFVRNCRKLEHYHTVNCHRVGKTIRGYIGEESLHAFRTYIKDDFDLNKRLSEAKNNLVVLAFVIPGDVDGERLNIDLDEINLRHEDVNVFKVDVDICKDVTAKFHVKCVPTIVFIKNGAILEEINAIETDRLGQAIAKYTKGKATEEQVMGVSVTTLPSTTQEQPVTSEEMSQPAAVKKIAFKDNE